MEKHFKKHNGFCACNRNKKHNLTEIWHKVTCDSCKKNGEYLMAKQENPKECKYPNLKKAIENKVEFFVKVNPEQSKEVQKIAFSCGLSWAFNGSNILHTDSKTLLFINGCQGVGYHIFTQSFIRKPQEFSLEHDCFVDEIVKCSHTELQGMDGGHESVEYSKPPEEKTELSACGKTYAEFMDAVNDDCSNVEFKYIDAVNTVCWFKPYATNKNQIKSLSNSLKNLRIIQTPPEEQEWKTTFDTKPSIVTLTNGIKPPKEQQEKDGWTDEAINNASFSKDDEICHVKIEDIIKVAVTNLCDGMQNYDVYKFGNILKDKLKGGE